MPRAEALRSVRVPTLVLHGSADTLIDPSGGRRTAELIPEATFVLLDGMGHDYPTSYWDQLVDLVTEHASKRGRRHTVMSWSAVRPTTEWQRIEQDRVEHGRAG